MYEIFTFRPTEDFYNHFCGQPETIAVSTGISEDLRDRVDEELKYFNEAFAAAQQNDTPQNFENLADAADRLMRAVGRVVANAGIGSSSKKSIIFSRPTVNHTGTPPPLNASIA